MYNRTENKREFPQVAPQLSAQEQSQVARLKARDGEVRAHEAAHKAAAGSVARGGASFSYTTGPDGRRYATGGEVGIDTSEVSGDPEATIRKAQTIRRAALAPARPSQQDRSVAAAASQMEAKARADLRKEKLEEKTESKQNFGISNYDNSSSGDEDQKGQIIEVVA